MNLIDGLDSRGIRWKKSSKSNEIWLCCPFCEENDQSPDTRFRLGVNIAVGKGQCFNCGWRSSKMAVFELRKKLDLGEWIQTEEVDSKKKLSPFKLPKDYEALDPEDDDFWNRKALKICRDKGVKDWQISKHKIGVSVVGKYAGRIIIPVYWSGKLEGMVTRAIKKSTKPKFKNSEGDKSLFGCPKKQSSHSCILSESCFDAMACERVFSGNFDCLGIMGHSLSDKQLRLLKNYSHFVIWLDPDEPGVKGTINSANQLQSYGRVQVVMPTSDERDPDEIPEKILTKRLGKARDWSDATENRLRTWLTYQED